MIIQLSHQRLVPFLMFLLIPPFNLMDQPPGYSSTVLVTVSVTVTARISPSAAQRESSHLHPSHQHQQQQSGPTRSYQVLPTRYQVPSTKGRPSSGAREIAGVGYAGSEYMPESMQVKAGEKINVK